MSEIAEVVADNVEDVVDGVVEVVEVLRTNIPLLVGVWATGIVAGAGLGYFYAVKSLGKKFDDKLTEEIEDAKAFYAQLNKIGDDGRVLTPQEVMAERHGIDAAVEALEAYQGENEVVGVQGDPGPNSDDGLTEVEPGILVDLQDEEQLSRTEAAVKTRYRREPKESADTAVEVEVNVFETPSYQKDAPETRVRDKDEPYVITKEEYYTTDLDYDQASLTYYEKDDTLTDEVDVPVEDVSFVGVDNLTKFGQGSEDNNTVYVRNEKLEIDYEITRSKRSYVIDVLGLPPEPNSLKHSDQRDRRRAFRHGEE